jgi:hypothetical protein
LVALPEKPGRGKEPRFSLVVQVEIHHPGCTAIKLGSNHGDSMCF